MSSTRTWRAQYDRMLRWRTRLTEPHDDIERTVDDFYAFFLCCFHLRDWLKADENLDPAIGAGAEAMVNEHSFFLKLCADIANASKHRTAELTARFDGKAHLVIKPGASAPAPLDTRPFITEPQVYILADGAVWPALTVADNSVAAWDRFLREQKLLP